jgi:hydroxymethylglutaryl-CoA reductase
LEQFAKTFVEEATDYKGFSEEEIPEIIMSILSNNIPECLVRAEVSCPVEEIGEAFAEKFITAIRIAETDPDRATTHNKGVMNGIDAVVIATGNDFRAVEAGAHAYAARSGSYSSLTHATLENGIFNYWIELPLALGTVGGLTNLHPLVKTALKILQNPSAKELMEIVAVIGLAQNFAAVKSLTTTGIQKGHMKMHLNNILNQLQATEEEKVELKEYFKTRVITHHAVEEALENLRHAK